MPRNAEQDKIVLHGDMARASRVRGISNRFCPGTGRTYLFRILPELAAGELRQNSRCQFRKHAEILNRELLEPPEL
jgi:hypothetical protein